MSSMLDRLKRLVGKIEDTDQDLAEDLRQAREKAGREALGPSIDLRGLESLRDATPSEIAALAQETIVLRTGRPVLAISENKLVFDKDNADSEVWRSRLASATAVLEKTIPAVGRVQVKGHNNDWLGTGWLVADDILVTNRHVAREFGKRSGDDFSFRTGFEGLMSSQVDFLQEIGRTAKREFNVLKILHIEDEPGPDIALLRIQNKGDDPLAKPIKIAEIDGAEKDDVVVIGYPASDSRIPDQDLMIRIYGNVFNKKRLAPGRISGRAAGNLLHDCTTLGGNSGSVVLALRTGQALGLHFSGRFLQANYAVAASALQTVLRDVTQGRPRRAKPEQPVAPANPPSQPTTSMAAGTRQTFTINIPVHISVEIGAPTQATVTVTPVAPTVPSPGGGGEAETFEEGRVEEYSDRAGYDPEFLGEGLRVPLPRVKNTSDILKFVVDGQTESVLKYHHFSVVMSKSRRLCYFSAVNVDGAHPGKIARVGWRIDPRIRKEQQILQECYGDPPKFSRGHMTRREDPVWGSAKDAERGNSDSMHATNVVPQMQPFNAGIWLALESYALRNARKDKMQISVFTGPFFRNDDPIRYGVAIPRSFWKVIAFVHDDTGKLTATGYTLSQEGFLREEEFVFGKHATAQISIAEIEQRAGISFGKLRERDPLDKEEAAPAPHELHDLTEIRFT